MPFVKILITKNINSLIVKFSCVDFLPIRFFAIFALSDNIHRSVDICQAHKMIKSIQFSSETRNSAHTHWAKDLPWIKDAKGLIEFTPGLNIVLGGNGTGKSTLMSALASHGACEQGGIPKITMSWALDNFDGNICKMPFKVDHDGELSFYSNGHQKVGLVGGHFDDSFFDEGVMNLAMPESHGESVLRSFKRLDALLGFKADSLPKTREVEYCGSNSFAEAVSKHFMPCFEPIGIRTLLLDEADTGMSLLWQKQFWEMIPKAVKDMGNIQVIVSTHSAFALNVDGANYIETSQGYREKCLKAIASIT